MLFALEETASIYFSGDCNNLFRELSEDFASCALAFVANRESNNITAIRQYISSGLVFKLKNNTVLNLHCPKFLSYTI